MITQLTVQQEQSVPSQDKKHNDITKKQEKARASKFDVKKENQKNEFLDETSIGEIYDEESRTETHNDSTGVGDMVDQSLISLWHLARC